MVTAASRLSSFWARALVAGIVLAVAAGVAVVLLGRGEGDDTAERREAVTAYIVELNKTQQVLALELSRVSDAYRELDLRTNEATGQVRRVEAAETSLRRLRARLASLDAPAEARRLRSLVLGLVDLQLDFAAEVSLLVRYLPVQAREGRRLAAVSVRLNRELGAATDAASQRAAFERYRRSLGGIVRRLEATSAPAVLEPARAEELARLVRLRARSLQVGRALAGQDADEVDRVFRGFVRANAPTGTTRAERDAVVAFNRRLAAINERRARIAAERTRLDIALR